MRRRQQPFWASLRHARFGAGVCLLFSLLAVLAAPRSEAAGGGLDGYYRETWTTREGLPHNTVDAIAQTPDGYLWVGSWEGVTRYSGHSFRNFDRNSGTHMPDSGVRSLAVDADGALLVGGGRGGLVSLREGEWSPLPSAPALVTSVLRDRGGALWVGTDGAGLMRIDSDGRRQHFAVQIETGGGSVYALLQDSRGRLWVGTSRGLMLLHQEQLRTVALSGENGENGESGERRRVGALALDPGGRLLVGGDHGLQVSTAAIDSLELDTFEFRSRHPQLQDIAVSRLLVGGGGSLWIGSFGSGLFRLQGEQLDQLDSRDGLPNNRILALFEDREGSLWIGTNGGLVRLGDAPFSSLTRRQGLADDFVRSVLELDDGSLLVGSSEGLDRIVAGEVQPSPNLAELRGRPVLSLARSSDGFVAGTYTDGVVRVRGDGRVERIDQQSGLPSNEVRSLLEAPDGSLWIGTTEGLVHWRADGFSLFRTAQGLPSNYVISLHLDAVGMLWVGTKDGLGRLHEGQAETIDLQAVEGVESIFGISAAARGQGLWLATDRGLLYLQRSDGRIGAVGFDAGLPFEKFFQALIDGRGNLWLSGNRGVLRLDAEQARGVALGQEERLPFEHFTEFDGMASAQCNGGSEPAASVRRDGSVWFATAKGLAWIDPGRLANFSQQAPPVVIEAVRADNAELSIRPPLEIAAGTSRIEVDFAGLAFVMPQRVRYRYRLEGFDSDWVERGALRSAVFTNLFPGDYSLRVQAAHPNGPWSEREARLDFSIAALWWQRPLTWLLALALLGLAAWRALRRHLRRDQQTAERLRALVEQRTAALQSQTERLLQADADQSDLLRQLQQQSEDFERQAREDSLTGLGNRRAFDELMAQEFALAGRSEQPLCMALIDLDHFKRVNDQYSHATGDAVLRAIAQQMRSLCREIDTVSRWGGEEFALLLPNTPLSDALLVCERVRSGIERTALDAIRPGLKITVSIGLASHEGHSDHDRMLAQADAALYAAKSAGRNRVAC